MELAGRLAERLDVAMVERGLGPDEDLTVGDVYQRLIPYRAVRGEVGVIELAEYEHALLRLLSGEHGVLELTDRSVANDIRRELDALNPILGIYRDCAGAVVRYHRPPASEVIPGFARAAPAGPSAAARTTAAGGEGADTVGPEATTRTPATSPPAAGVGGATEAAADSTRTRRSDSMDPAANPPTSTATPELTFRSGPPSGPVPRSCTGCDRAIPDLPELRFCPFCGGAVEPRPCATCRAPLEGDWSFCIRCGTPRS